MAKMMNPTSRQKPAWAIRMAEERKLQKLSQVKMADDLNISQSAYADYETGRSEPSLEMFTNIAVRLRISPQWLIFGQGEKEVSGMETSVEVMPLYMELYHTDDLFKEVASKVEKALREMMFFHRDFEFITLCTLKVCKSLEAMHEKGGKPIDDRAVDAEVSWLKQKILNGQRRTRIDIIAGITHE